MPLKFATKSDWRVLSPNLVWKLLRRRFHVCDVSSDDMVSPNLSLSAFTCFGTTQVVHMCYRFSDSVALMRFA